MTPFASLWLVNVATASAGDAQEWCGGPVSLPSGSGEAGGCQTSPFPAPVAGGGGALWELEGCLRPLSLWACSSGLHALPAGASLPAGPFSHAAYTSQSCVSFCVLVSKVTEW